MHSILISKRLFDLPSALQSALRAQQLELSSIRDPIVERFDAFVLDPGMGPVTYLSSDGRIIWDEDCWDVLASLAYALAAIVVGARKTRLSQLRELLPPRPIQSVDCPECAASGWYGAHLRLKDVHGKPVLLVCVPCGGLGWTSATLDLGRSVLERSIPQFI